MCTDPSWGICRVRPDDFESRDWCRRPDSNRHGVYPQRFLSSAYGVQVGQAYAESVSEHHITRRPILTVKWYGAGYAVGQLAALILFDPERIAWRPAVEFHGGSHRSGSLPIGPPPGAAPANSKAPRTQRQHSWARLHGRPRPLGRSPHPPQRERQRRTSCDMPL